MSFRPTAAINQFFFHGNRSKTSDSPTKPLLVDGGGTRLSTTISSTSDSTSTANSKSLKSREIIAGTSFGLASLTSSGVIIALGAGVLKGSLLALSATILGVAGATVVLYALPALIICALIAICCYCTFSNNNAAQSPNRPSTTESEADFSHLRGTFFPFDATGEATGEDTGEDLEAFRDVSQADFESVKTHFSPRPSTTGNNTPPNPPLEGLSDAEETVNNTPTPSQQSEQLSDAEDEAVFSPFAEGERHVIITPRNLQADFETALAGFNPHQLATILQELDNPEPGSASIPSLLALGANLDIVCNQQTSYDSMWDSFATKNAVQNQIWTQKHEIITKAKLTFARLIEQQIQTAQTFTDLPLDTTLQRMNREPNAHDLLEQFVKDAPRMHQLAIEDTHAQKPPVSFLPGDAQEKAKAITEGLQSLATVGGKLDQDLYIKLQATVSQKFVILATDHLTKTFEKEWKGDRKQAARIAERFMPILTPRFEGGSKVTKIDKNHFTVTHKFTVQLQSLNELGEAASLSEPRNIQLSFPIQKKWWNPSWKIDQPTWTT